MAEEDVAAIEGSGGSGGVALDRLRAQLANEREEREIQLIEQEHRFFPAVRNFLAEWRSGRRGRRFQAASIALAWRVFFRVAATGAVGGGLIVGVGTLWLMAVQNELIRTQNERLQAQTRQVVALTQQQVEEARETRNASLIKTVYERKECGKEPCEFSADLRSRVAAAAAIAQMPKGRRRDLSGVVFNDSTLSAVEFLGTNLVAADFHCSRLNSVVFDESSAQRTKFSDSIFTGGSFVGADLMGADFRFARLAGVDFGGAILCGVDFRGASMPNARLHGASFRCAAQDEALREAVAEDWMLNVVADLGAFLYPAISQAQLQVTQGDSATVLPLQPLALGYPCHWDGVQCDKAELDLGFTRPVTYPDEQIPQELNDLRVRFNSAVETPECGELGGRALMPVDVRKRRLEFQQRTGNGLQPTNRPVAASPG